MHVPCFSSKVYIHRNANTSDARCREGILPYETQAQNIKAHMMFQYVSELSYPLFMFNQKEWAGLDLVKYQNQI